MAAGAAATAASHGLEPRLAEHQDNEQVARRLKLRTFKWAGAVLVATGSYGVTFGSWMQMRTYAEQVASSHVASHVFNNVSQVAVLFALMIFFAAAFPDDLETAMARKCLGLLLLVGNLGDLLVIYEHHRMYAATRDFRPEAPWSVRAAIWINYALLAFVVVAGLAYPTYIWARRECSWHAIRRGLFLDGACFLLAISALAALGEERFPPGDVPLAAAFGRPVAALLGAALFDARRRRRIASLASQLGAYHVRLHLNELPSDDFRKVLFASGDGMPVASGNLPSMASSNGQQEHHITDDEDFSASSEVTGPARSHVSHYTSKLDGEGVTMLEEHLAMAEAEKEAEAEAEAFSPLAVDGLLDGLRLRRSPALNNNNTNTNSRSTPENNSSNSKSA